MSTKTNLQIALDFIKGVENRMPPDDLSIYYANDVEQIEYPNALVKNGVTRTLDMLKEGSLKGRQVISKEVYDIVNAYEQGDTVIIEAIWTCTLAIPLGSLKAGDDMKANFAQFFDFKDGKIIRQRNYDCFQPFA